MRNVGRLQRGTRSRWWLCGMLAILAVTAGGLGVRGQDTAVATRLSAPKLFPERTLAYFRIDDVSRLRADMAETSLGRLSDDDRIKPILSEFYGSLVRNMQQLQDAIGLNLDELLSIPNGEFAIALFAGEASRSEPAQEEGGEGRQRGSNRDRQPVVAVLLDAGPEIASVRLLLHRMDEEATKSMLLEEKEVGRLTLHRYRHPHRSRQAFGYFIDDSVIVACSDPEFLELLADKWMGGLPDAKTMADNRKFTQIMAKCVGAEGERPQMSFYVDPLGLVRQFVPRNAGTSMMLAMLPALGLDGIEAVGGSWIIGPPGFDAISHLHVLLSSPRRELLALLRPQAGSTTPERWVPESVSSYATVNWDLQATVEAFERIYNQFRGEEALEQEVFARVRDRFDIDVRRDVLENLQGRLSIVQGIVRPARLNSASNVYAFRLINPDALENNVLPKLIAQLEQRTEVSRETFGPLKAFVVRPNRAVASDAPIRQPEICFAVVDDYLVISDSTYMMRQLAGCLNGTIDALADSLEFQLINDRITEQLQGRQCAGISYSRPEESLQLFYELARDPKNRDRLRQFAGERGFFRALLETLEKHELPPFSVISKYLAPGGSFLVDEETGLHVMSFSLRRQ